MTDRLTAEQRAQLLRPIHPKRVGDDGKGHSSVAQHDVRAHLIRIFGFCNYDEEILDSSLVFEFPRRSKPDDPITAGTRWDVCYRATVRLTFKSADGTPIAVYEEGAAETAENQKRGDGHGQAMRSAISQALKRCAINLGDQFGLGLYNKGSLAPLVVGSLVGNPPAQEGGTTPPAADVQADVPQAQLDEESGFGPPELPPGPPADEHSPDEPARTPPVTSQGDPQLPAGQPGDPLPSERPAAQQQPQRSPLDLARARHKSALTSLHPDWTPEQRRDATVTILAERKDPSGWPVTVDTATVEDWAWAASYWEDELEQNRQQAAIESGASAGQPAYDGTLSSAREVARAAAERNAP
jgi:hypothetical protein